MLNALALTLVLAAAPKVDSPLVGTWLAGDAPFVTFNANGTGQMDDGAIRWAADKTSITVTDNEGATDKVSYQLSGDSLTINMGGAAVALTRMGGAGGKGKLAAKLAKNNPTAETPPPEAPPKAAPGTCQAACEHFAKCIGQPDSIGPCVVNCMSKNPDPQQLAVYTTLDCQRAIAVVAQQAQQAQGGQARKNTSSQCNGCVRDGNSCVWISQGNWGTGYANPYSGAVSSCDPSCCGM